MVFNEHTHIQRLKQLKPFSDDNYDGAHGYHFHKIAKKTKWKFQKLINMWPLFELISAHKIYQPSFRFVPFHSFSNICRIIYTIQMHLMISHTHTHTESQKYEWFHFECLLVNWFGNDFKRFHYTYKTWQIRFSPLGTPSRPM